MKPRNPASRILPLTFNTTSCEVSIISYSPEMKMVYYYVSSKPIAEFEYNPINPKISETIKFNASMSYDPDGYIVEYVWTFGDGTIIITTNPVVYHSYLSAGLYNVTLIVKDNDGLEGFVEKIIKISKGRISYDFNKNGKIEDKELIQAIMDWLADRIDDLTLIDIILRWI